MRWVLGLGQTIRETLFKGSEMKAAKYAIMRFLPRNET